MPTLHLLQGAAFLYTYEGYRGTISSLSRVQENPELLNY